MSKRKRPIGALLFCSQLKSDVCSYQSRNNSYVVLPLRKRNNLDANSNAFSLCCFCFLPLCFLLVALCMQILSPRDCLCVAQRPASKPLFCARPSQALLCCCKCRNFRKKDRAGPHVFSITIQMTNQSWLAKPLSKNFGRSHNAGCVAGAATNSSLVTASGPASATSQ